jgi:hypothetical protein
MFSKQIGPKKLPRAIQNALYDWGGRLESCGLGGSGGICVERGGVEEGGGEFLFAGEVSGIWFVEMGGRKGNEEEDTRD